MKKPRTSHVTKKTQTPEVVEFIPHPGHSRGFGGGAKDGVHFEIALQRPLLEENSQRGMVAIDLLSGSLSPSGTLRSKLCCVNIVICTCAATYRYLL